MSLNRSKRRDFLTTATILAVAGWLRPTFGLADWLEERFRPGPFADTLQRLFPNRDFIDSEQVLLTLPKVAENGAKVPFTIESSLSDVQKLFVLVEKNPTPLAAELTLSPEALVSVSGRIKMAETCHVVAIVASGDKLYRARQRVEVTVGGCGG